MLCAGTVAATVANCAPFGDKDRKSISPIDFVPDWKKRTEPEPSQTLEQQVEILTQVFGCGPGKPSKPLD